MNKRIVLILLSLLPAISAVVSYIYFDLSVYTIVALIALTFFFLSFTLSKDRMQTWDLMVELEQEKLKQGNYKNKIQQYMHEHSVSACLISITILAILLVIGYFSIHTPYVLRPDRFHRITVFLLVIFSIAVIIELIIIKRKERKKQEHFPIFFLIGLIIAIFFGIVKTSAIFLLKYSNIPFLTTNAFVTKYDKATRSSSDEYTLRFASNQVINSKEFEIVAETYAQAGDCFRVQYRKNAVVIEVRPVKNLGKMSEKECLAQ